MSHMSSGVCSGELPIPVLAARNTHRLDVQWFISLGTWGDRGGLETTKDRARTREVVAC